MIVFRDNPNNRLLLTLTALALGIEPEGIGWRQEVIRQACYKVAADTITPSSFNHKYRYEQLIKAVRTASDD